MSANSQFDKFLQEKFLANEAARRVKVEKPMKDKFIIRKNANMKNGDRNDSNLFTKSSISPKYRALQEDIDQDYKRTSEMKSPISISNMGHNQSKM